MTQAIVLAAGVGKRLGKLGTLYPKIALPIGGRPLYELHIDLLVGQGIKELIFIVAPGSDGLSRSIEAYVSAVASDMTVRFVIQSEPRGIGHAINLCRALTASQFIVLLGDTYFQVNDFRSAFTLLQDPKVMAVLSVRRELDHDVIRRECSIQVDRDGHVTTIVEKPATVLSDLKPCGIYFFKKEIHAVIEATPPSPLRNEIEITDAIARMIASGNTVATALTIGHDVNITFEKNFLEANARYLQAHNVDSIIAPDARVAASANIVRSVIGARSIIGDGAQVLRSVVLPGVSIPAQAYITDAVVYPEQ